MVHLLTIPIRIYSFTGPLKEHRASGWAVLLPQTVAEAHPGYGCVCPRPPEALGPQATQLRASRRDPESRPCNHDGQNKARVHLSHVDPRRRHMGPSPGCRGNSTKHITVHSCNLGYRLYSF